MPNRCCITTHKVCHETLEDALEAQRNPPLNKEIKIRAFFCGYCVAFHNGRRNRSGRGGKRQYEERYVRAGKEKNERMQR